MTRFVRWRRLLTGVSTVGMVLWPSAASGQGEGLAITFLDVGQGDAVVIQTPDGRVAMVDAGRSSPLRQLTQMGVTELALVVASHAHADHIGGLDDVLTARPVDTYLDNGAPHTTDTYLELMAHVERLDLQYLEAVPRTIRIGEVSFEVLPMPPAADDQNNRSVGLLIRYGDFSALLTGDAEREQLDHWVRSGSVEDIDVLKAPHHGAADGFTYDFLDRTQPEVVVISVGADNAFGHPRAEALAAYSTFADQVLRTDRSGSITVVGFPDGTFELHVEKGVGADPLPAQLGDTLSVEVNAWLALSVEAAPRGIDSGDLNDEYVVIENQGPIRLDIGSWRLCDLSSRCFVFPPGANVASGRRVVVYSGYGHTDGVAFFMNNGRAVWNGDGDQATLFDAAGNEVSRYVYE